jgi:hypothetical protein
MSIDVKLQGKVADAAGAGWERLAMPWRTNNEAPAAG